MTQTSGKTGPVVGVRVEEEGLQGGLWGRGDVSSPFPGSGGPELRGAQ